MARPAIRAFRWPRDRFIWIERALAMRSATVADASGSSPRTIDAAEIAGIQTQMSIRSRSGPEIRLTYRSGAPFGHVQSDVPAFPQRHACRSELHHGASRDRAPGGPAPGTTASSHGFGPVNGAQLEFVRTWSGQQDERYFDGLAGLETDADGGDDRPRLDDPVPIDGHGAPRGDPLSAAPNEPAAFNRTDAGNGEHFARLYGERIRFDHRRGRWLLWAGHWWREDDRGAVRRLAKDAARVRYQAAPEIDDLRGRAIEARFAIASENRQRIEAMLMAARSEPPIADAGNEWNADPWLLGVANGVVDLRTGALRPGEPGDRITFHSAVAFDPDAGCPRWEQFLDEIFEGDQALVGFIARAVGYSLTGAAREQCLFTCHGSGSNGKSTFLTVLRDLAGDYAANTPFSTFELHSRSAIPNDLAALAGRRLVTASETAEGTRLNEARLKALTGGDEITARFLHGEFFSFAPVAKFWLAVNHKPRVNDDSYGFWRRVRLIPFLRRFTDDGDQDLGTKLEAELPGILAWAVRGALAWQAEGLQPPAAVTLATATYRDESDPLADFLATCTIEGPAHEVAAAMAFRAYGSWADEQGMTTRERLTSTAFGTRLAERYEKRKTKTGRIYVGIGLLSDRLGAAGTGPVTGWVTGSEHGDTESGLSPASDPPSREDLDSDVTTHHPSPGTADDVAVEDDYPRSAWQSGTEQLEAPWS